MMTLTNASRKRECSEDTDYMPVTKRMNCLHIDATTNGFGGISDQLTNGQTHHSEAQLRDLCLIRNQNQNQIHCHSTDCINNSEHCLQHVLGHYCPSLDSHSNPFYYEPNRILFEAHQHRLNRLANRHLIYRKS